MNEASGAIGDTHPYYTEQELDALYEQDPVLALRISRDQARLAHELDAPAGDTAAVPSEDGIREALETARRVLLRDGGDLEFVALEDAVVRVRLKGACAGCPRSALDLKQVVERAVRSRFPQIRRVENIR